METLPNYNTPLPWREPSGPDGTVVHLPVTNTYVSAKLPQSTERRCVRTICGHALLPQGKWYPDLCPRCLEEVQAAQRGQWQQRGGLSVMTYVRPADALKIIVTCYFCPTRVAVPPGESLNAPLLCEACFQQVIIAKRKLVPTSLPSHIQCPPSTVRGNQMQMYPPEHYLRLSRPILHHPPTYIPEVNDIPCQSTFPWTNFHQTARPTRSPTLSGHADPSPIIQPQLLPLPQASTSETDQPMDVDMNDDFDDLKLEYPSDDPDSVKAESQPAEGIITSRTVTLPDGWESEMSALTDLSDSDEEEMPDVGRDEGLSGKTGLKLRIRLPPGFSFDKLIQPRKCGFKTCKSEIEPGSRWKMCQPCRAKFRKYQRERLGFARPRLDAQFDMRGMDVEEQVTEESPDGVRSCTTPHCHARLPSQEEYQWLRCKSCRNRHRYQAKRRRVISLVHGKSHGDDEGFHGGLSHHILDEYSRQMARRKKAGLLDDEVMHPLNGRLPAEATQSEPIMTKSYPTFQSRHLLLSNLRFHIAGFLQAQAMYVRAKLEQGIKDDPLRPFGFSFDGAFAVVTGGELKSENTIRMLLDVQRGIENVLGIVLSNPSPPTVTTELVTQMTFRHTMVLPIPGFPASSNTSEDISVKAEEKCKPTLQNTEEVQAMPGDDKGTLKTSFSPLMPKNDLPASDGAMTGCDPPTHDVSAKENDPDLKRKSGSSHGGLVAPSLPGTESSPHRRPVIMTRDVTGEVEIRVSEDRHHPFLMGHNVLVKFRLTG